MAETAAPREVADGEPVLTTKTLVYRLCSSGAWLWCKLAHRIEIVGAQHIPASGGAVLASNHQSHLDILILGGCVERHVCFVARDTLAEASWLAFTMRQCGAVLVKRGAGDRAALRAMAAHLERGDLVAIFPEGTRTRDGTVGELKGGALLAARMARVPIVPTAIRGAFEAFPRGAAFPRPRKVVLAFGPPIDSSLPDAQERMETAIRTLAGDGRVARGGG